MWGALKQFDAYPKTLEDFRVKTYVGASSECGCSLLSAAYNPPPPPPSSSHSREWSYNSGVISVRARLLHVH